MLVTLHHCLLVRRGTADCGEGVFHRSIGSAGFRDEVGIELVVIYLGLVQSFDKLFGVRRQPIVVLVLSHPGIKLVLILRCRGLSLDIVGIIVEFVCYVATVVFAVVQV